MTSYLVEGALLVALVATIAGLIIMRRELKQLKADQASYSHALDETGVALISVGSAIRDINMQGLNTLQRLVAQIDAARSVLDELERANAEAGVAKNTELRAVSRG